MGEEGDEGDERRGRSRFGSCVNLSFPFLSNGQYGTKDDSRLRMMNSGKDMIKTLFLWRSSGERRPLPFRFAVARQKTEIASVDHLLENILFNSIGAGCVSRCARLNLTNYRTINWARIVETTILLGLDRMKSILLEDRVLENLFNSRMVRVTFKVNGVTIVSRRRFSSLLDLRRVKNIWRIYLIREYDLK